MKEQEALIPLEQAARQKVAELKSVQDSEKSQGSVLKAILNAKESNQIQGIYGRMGDLGAIDGECYVHFVIVITVVTCHLSSFRCYLKLPLNVMLSCVGISRS